MLWQCFPMARVGEPDNAPAVELWDCAFNWHSRLLFSSNLRLNGVQAATESFRNETIERQDRALALAQRGNGRLIDATGAD